MRRSGSSSPRVPACFSAPTSRGKAPFSRPSRRLGSGCRPRTIPAGSPRRTFAPFPRSASSGEKWRGRATAAATACTVRSKVIASVGSRRRNGIPASSLRVNTTHWPSRRPAPTTRCFCASSSGSVPSISSGRRSAWARLHRRRTISAPTFSTSFRGAAPAAPTMSCNAFSTR